jgi:hypothetical protein
MSEKKTSPIGRRDLLVKTAPACAMACLGLGATPNLVGLLAREARPPQQKPRDRFDQVLENQPPEFTQRSFKRLDFRRWVRFIDTLQEELGHSETIRLLNANSEKVGRELGERQARDLRAQGLEPTFERFVSQFRPPRFSDQLTHEVVVDTEDTFELRVTECANATVFEELGCGGEIGHAMVCNMDFAWPRAFDPSFRMERDKTLMQGDDHCNHKYKRTT